MAEADRFVPARNARGGEPTQDDLALLFVATYADRLRHCAALGGWQVYERGCWRRDDVNQATDLVRQLLRDLVGRAKGRLRKLLTTKTVDAILRLARSDPRIAVTAEVFDADPWVLNTPDGLIDLRTGQLRPAQPQDHCRRQTAVCPASPGTGLPEAAEAFLIRITNGDEGLYEFLQRIAGYSLTGSTREQVLFFAHGTGANGKTTFINVIRECLGSYAIAAPMETFMAATSDRHPTELAMLMGPRFVTASESEDRGWLAASRIKLLTGGESVSARFMHGNFFQFTPQFKLLLSGNHRPRLKSVDPAIQRRIHLVPFTVTIPPEERDGELPAKLRHCYPAFLRWMIDGCLLWQLRGLEPPAAVTTATSEYLEEQDSIGRWLTERCELAKASSERTSALYQDFSEWAKADGEWDMGVKRFGRSLHERGLPRHRTGDSRLHLGLKLKPKATDSTPEGAGA